MKWNVIKLYCSIMCITCCCSASAQYYFYNNKFYDNDVVFELGASIGIMNSITDLGGQAKQSKVYLNEINWQNATNAAGVYAAMMYQQTLGVRLEATFGSVKGHDSLLQKGSPRFERNLSFKSDIRELALLVEFHPLMLKYAEEPPHLSPYVLAGAGWYSFNPQGNLNGTWIDLKPLSTEGQGFTEFPTRQPYRLSQANLAAGLGVKYELFQSVNLRLEWLHRYLFTDYLDDVSQGYIDPALFSKYFSPAKALQAQAMNTRGLRNDKNRGEPENKDVYFSINLKLGVTLGRTRR